MFKRNILSILILALLSCSNSQNDQLIFEPHIQKLLDYFISYNENLTQEDYFIRIIGTKTNINNFRLYINAEILKNSCFTFNDSEEEVFYTEYKKFKVTVDGDYQMLMKKQNSLIKLEKDTGLYDYIPNNYNPPLWEFIINNKQIVKFDYLFCNLNDQQEKEIMLISIPKNWFKNNE